MKRAASVMMKSGKKPPELKYQIRHSSETIAAPRLSICPPGSFSAADVTLPRELAIRNDRPGKGNRPDKDAKEQLNPQDRLLGAVLLGQKRPKALQSRLARLVHRQNAAELEMGVEPHKDRRQTNERMHRRDQLWHLRHLNPRGQS